MIFCYQEIQTIEKSGILSYYRAIESFKFKLKILFISICYKMQENNNKIP